MTPIHHRERKNQVFFAWLVPAGLSDRFFDDFHGFSAFSQMRNLCFVPCLPSKTEVRPFALRAKSLARRNLAKPRKSAENQPEIVGNRASGAPGSPSRSTFAAQGAGISGVSGISGSSGSSDAAESPESRECPILQDPPEDKTRWRLRRSPRSPSHLPVIILLIIIIV